MSLAYVGDSGVYSFFGKLNKIVGNVVKDMLLKKGTKGTKAKKLGKRVHYFNQMIFKNHLKSDIRRHLLR